MKKLRITIEGKTYEVEVEILDEGGPASPSTQPASAAGSVSAAPAAASVPTAPTAGPGIIPSPLAGRVVTIDAKIGQKVNAGDQLIVLEAMKMNTFISAPRSGTVAEILVAEGDAVEEGQGLVKFS